jgi:small subunit ribosomal protein S2
MPEIPTLEELLKKGVHFGHKEAKWHPNMAPFIYTSRNGVHVLDLQKTQEQIKRAIDFAQAIAAANQVILFVGTKKAVKSITKKHAQSADCPYVTERWLGGTITNFKSIKGLSNKLQDLEKQAKAADYSAKYTKKERLDFSEEMKRLEKMIGGIRHLEKLPDVLFVADVRTDKTAVREAQRKQIPIIALVDSNVDPAGIDYPIAANDDSLKSVELISSLIVEAINEGKKNQAEKNKEESNNTES